MKEQFGTVVQSSKTEVRRRDKPTAFLLIERGSCSPRGAVALSVFAGVRWLQNRWKSLRRRMARRGPHTLQGGLETVPLPSTGSDSPLT
jgi:hypothetical protein